MASKTHFVCLHVLSLILLLVLAVVVSGDEFYGILGVSRSANNDEIRKAYRRLAREWHPDKNTNYNAQEKFIKINEAYETLSDPKKREDYDRYGESGAPSQWQREHEFFQDSGFMYFNGMPFQFQSNWKHRDFTTLNYFKKTILPESFKKLYLLQIVSDWCINCAAVEEIWEYTARELKSLGLGTGRVNRNIDPQLAKELGARKLPDFVGVISGKIYHYSGTVSIENLRDFVNGLFPNNLVPEVTNSTLPQFLYHWYDNMPRALLFTTKTAPPLLLKIVSFKYQDNVRIGYIQLTKPGNSETRERFGAEKDEPTFAIFKENTSQPDLLLKGSELKSGTLDEVLSENLYLHFPRISSGTMFEKLCPQEAILSQRSLCVILFTNVVPYRPKQHPLLTMSKDRAWSSRKVRFTYVHQEQQRSFENSIKMTEETRSVCSDKKMSKKVAIVWHVKKREVKYSWLDGGWCGSKDVARLTAKLNRILSGKVKLELSAVVGEMNNEHAKHFLSWLLDLCNDVVYYTFHYINWSGNLPTLSLVMTLGFVFIISCLFPSISGKDSNLKANEEDQHPSTANDAFGLVQLDSQTQDKFIHRAKQGQLLVVLLSDATSQSQAVRSPIVQIFADITRLYLRENIFIFGWLSIQDHIAWCNEVMKVQTFGQIKPGTILAINGAKKYLSIFKVKRQLKNDYDQSTAGNIFDDSEDEDTEASSMVFQEDKRTQKRIAEALGRQLPTWLEKLFEGMVSRVKLDNWPRMECDK